jgi:hypothetical protein
MATHIFNVVEDRKVEWVGFRGQVAGSAPKGGTIVQCMRMPANGASALVDRLDARVVRATHDRVEQSYGRDRSGQQRGVIGVRWEMWAR